MNEFDIFLKDNWSKLYWMALNQIQKYKIINIDPDDVRNEAFRKVVQANKENPKEILDMLSRGSLMAYIKLSIKSAADELKDKQQHNPIDKPDASEGIFTKKEIKAENSKEAIEAEKFNRTDLTARASDKERITEEIIANLEDESNQNSEEMITNQQNKEIFKSLIDDTSFEIARLTFQQGYKSHEIAEKLNMNPNTVRTKLAEIRLMVRNNMIETN